MPLSLAFKVFAEKPVFSLMRLSLYATSHFFLASFRILSLFLTFTILIIMFLVEYPFGFILFGTLWLPEPGLSYPRFQKFVATIPSNNFSDPFSLFFFWNPSNINVIPFAISSNVQGSVSLFCMFFFHFAALPGLALLLYLPTY